MSSEITWAKCSPQTLAGRIVDVMGYDCGCEKEAERLAGLPIKRIIFAFTDDLKNEIFRYTDARRWVLMELADGRFATWAESEDYTGHG